MHAVLVGGLRCRHVGTATVHDLESPLFDQGSGANGETASEAEKKRGLFRRS